MYPTARQSTSALVIVPFAFAGGSLALIAFMLIFFVAIVIGYYTRRGSGIDLHPYGKIYSSAPGARARAHLSGPDKRRDDYYMRPRGKR